ncbi:type I restriction enzyme HsdR N-terminal domain-containing protein [Elizabethkingia sp. JS20170427COW]|uniref:type I restriction enzyme HsdR N-terminal domain-containing protein n=1 Tax=Elizabethkingia sp. JS20170427COW TaxID=2583851 RepID=UPI001110EC41|nr:type I restriction enzyme HsdR N-terminal domain-containing protein [Elizabethkingia sp. JS20170427COW]QCX54158.1 type I restriction enzyme HsdR N-terminal domain-containing protein [Elizabethkingia sp. JS20170427COW]
MELPKLNFNTQFDFKFRQDKDKFFIYDVLRKSYLLLTPEEWVRQHWVHYYLSIGKAASSLIAEKKVRVEKTTKRIDLLVLDKIEADILIECKAPQIKLKPEHFEQIARYNSVIQAKEIILSNGLQHIFAKYQEGQYYFYPKEL